MGNSATVPIEHDFDDGHHNKKSFRGKSLTAHGDQQKKKKTSKKSDMIPEPDYSDSEDPENRRKPRPGLSNGVQFTEDGLVVPKKPTNPCLESSERQNLHRELLFNQKIGKSVIGQKTELQKAMEKFRDEQKKKELEEQKINKKTAFEKKLEEQANKLKQQEELEAKKVESQDQPEFLRVHARVCAQAVDSTS